MSKRLTLAAFVCFLSLPPLAAQQPSSRSPFPVNPFLVEEMMTNPRLARARFEADQANPEQRARERYELARKAVEARMMELEAGRIYTDVLLESFELLFQAQRDLGGDANLVSALVIRWRNIRLAEAVIEHQFARGTAKQADLAQVRATRWEAEIDLFRNRPAPPKRLVEPGFGRQGAGEDFLDDARELARDLFQAEQRTQEERSRQRYAAARLEVELRIQEILAFLSGRLLHDDLLDCAQRLYRAQVQLGGESRLLAALEGRWRSTREAEKIREAKFVAGTAKEADLAEARASRLEAETDLVRARREHPQVKADVGVGLESVLGEDDSLLDYNMDLAKARFQAEQTIEGERSHDRLQTARTEMRGRLEELLVGRVTTDVLVDARRRLLETQRQLGGEANLAPALEESWRLSWLLDEILEARRAVGTAKVADCYQAKVTVLQVESELARVKERSKPR
jgi:hypothetical protein